MDTHDFDDAMLAIDRAPSEQDRQEARDFRAALLANLRHIGATLEDTYLAQTGGHGGPFLNEVNETCDAAVKSTAAYIEKWGSKEVPE